MPPKRGTGRQSRKFIQGLPTTSRVGWLLLVHGPCILQIQLLEEDAVGISHEYSFLGGSHHQSSRSPAPAHGRHLWEHRTHQMCPREAHPGTITTLKLPFSLPVSLGTKTLPEARSWGLLSLTMSFSSQSPREVQLAFTKTMQTGFENR